MTSSNGLCSDQLSLSRENADKPRDASSTQSLKLKPALPPKNISKINKSLALNYKDTSVNLYTKQLIKDKNEEQNSNAKKLPDKSTSNVDAQGPVKWGDDSNSNRMNTIPRQTLPPDDSNAVLTVSTENKIIFDEFDTFHSYLTIPKHSDKNIDVHSSGSMTRYRSEELIQTKTCMIVESLPEYINPVTESMLISARIEPSAERTLGPSRMKDVKEVALDPRLSQLVPADVDDTEELDEVHYENWRDGRVPIQTSYYVNVNPDDSSDKHLSPSEEDVKKLNSFFGETKETATELETKILKVMMSGKRMNPDMHVDMSRTTQLQQGGGSAGGQVLSTQVKDNVTKKKKSTNQWLQATTKFPTSGQKQKNQPIQVQH